MQLYRWILNRNGTWHCWPLRGRSTLCGRINTEHLRQQPADAITDKPAADGKLCISCARKSGYGAQVAACADATTSAWIGLINRYLKRKHVRVGAETANELARRLAEIGAPDSAEACAVFEQLQPLLLRPVHVEKEYVTGTKRTSAALPHLKESLAKLPAEPGCLRRVADALTTWQRVTNRNPWMERFRPERVIDTMLQVPDVELYVKHLVGRNLPTLAAVFHPNTLERARRDTALRGMFAGSGSYWEATATQLHIVED